MTQREFLCELKAMVFFLAEPLLRCTMAMDQEFARMKTHSMIHLENTSPHPNRLMKKNYESGAESINWAANNPRPDLDLAAK